MKILLVCAGGLGHAVDEIVAGRSFFGLKKMSVADGGHRLERDVLERPTS